MGIKNILLKIILYIVLYITYVLIIFMTFRFLMQLMILPIIYKYSGISFPIASLFFIEYMIYILSMAILFPFFHITFRLIKHYRFDNTFTDHITVLFESKKQLINVFVVLIITSICLVFIGLTMTSI